MSEIMLYGTVGTEIKANLVEKIKKGDILRINSYGGDVFEAQAIYNIIKGKGIICQIDGICASAATLIACGCEQVTMPRNAVYMIHEPSTLCSEFLTTTKAEQLLKSLKAVEETIIEVYKSRIGRKPQEIEEMLKNETWMTATEALEYGFIDELTAEEIDIEDRIDKIFIGGKSMDEQTMYQRFKSWLSNEEGKKTEENRIKTLESVKTDSIAQQAIINLAKQDGRALNDIQPELDAIAIAEKENRGKLNSEFMTMLQDYFDSKANEVGRSPIKSETTPIDEVVKYANEVIK